jgi:hypothetical protein
MVRMQVSKVDLKWQSSQKMKPIWKGINPGRPDTVMSIGTQTPGFLACRDNLPVGSVG